MFVTIDKALKFTSVGVFFSSCKMNFEMFDILEDVIVIFVRFLRFSICAPNTSRFYYTVIPKV